MKNLKRLAGLLLALILALGMMAPALAEDEKGSITITKINEKGIYEIYKMMDLLSYTDERYSYKIVDAWREFFEKEVIQEYISIHVSEDNSVYASEWVASEDDDTLGKFGKLALEYAKEKNITPVKSNQNVGDATVEDRQDGAGKDLVFGNLDLGYYLVDSSMGALCGLTNTDPYGVVNAKNFPPEADKQVQEDSTGYYGDSNSADIGQTVNFRITIDVAAGAEKYVVHDKMDVGLDFTGITSIRHQRPGETGEMANHEVRSEYYTVHCCEEDKSFVTNPTVADFEEGYVCSVFNSSEVGSETKKNECTFEIRFTKEFCDLLKANDKIIIDYTAVVNEDAHIGPTSPDENSMVLTYADKSATTEDKTYTYTYGFDIVKTDSKGNLINGAQFKLYDSATGGNEIRLVPVDPEEDPNNKGDWDYEETKGYTLNPGKGKFIVKTFKRAKESETGVTIFVRDGLVRVIGLDNGTYYLQETEAPQGYNPVQTRKEIIINNANLDASFTNVEDGNQQYSSGSGVHVINKTGEVLPETGGIGTTLFYAIGGVLVAAAVVLLVTRKRMAEK